MNKEWNVGTIFSSQQGKRKTTAWDGQSCMILISLRLLANPFFTSLPSSCLFFRESSGALHHGNEPVIDLGFGIPHDLPSSPTQTGFAEADPEKSHLPQQKFPGFAVGSGSSTDKEKENMSDPVVKRGIYIFSHKATRWFLGITMPASLSVQQSRLKRLDASSWNLVRLSGFLSTQLSTSLTEIKVAQITQNKLSVLVFIFICYWNAKR